MCPCCWLLPQGARKVKGSVYGWVLVGPIDVAMYHCDTWGEVPSRSLKPRCRRAAWTKNLSRALETDPSDMSWSNNSSASRLSTHDWNEKRIRLDQEKGGKHG